MKTPSSGKAIHSFLDPVSRSPSSRMGLRRESMLAALLGASTLHGVTGLETSASVVKAGRMKGPSGFLGRKFFSDAT